MNKKIFWKAFKRLHKEIMENYKMWESDLYPSGAPIAAVIFDDKEIITSANNVEEVKEGDNSCHAEHICLKEIEGKVMASDTRVLITLTPCKSCKNELESIKEIVEVFYLFDKTHGNKIKKIKGKKLTKVDIKDIKGNNSISLFDDMKKIHNDHEESKTKKGPKKPWKMRVK